MQVDEDVVDRLIDQMKESSLKLGAMAAEAIAQGTITPEQLGVMLMGSEENIARLILEKETGYHEYRMGGISLELMVAMSEIKHSLRSAIYGSGIITHDRSRQKSQCKDPDCPECQSLPTLERLLKMIAKARPQNHFLSQAVKQEESDGKHETNEEAAAEV